MPRTFSIVLNLNKQMVEFLQEVCFVVGSQWSQGFIRKIILKNPFILIQEHQRIKANIEFHSPRSASASNDEL